MALDWQLRPILFPVVMILVVHQSALTYSVSESEALIQLKNSFNNATALTSWVPGSDPCRRDSLWLGVQCLDGSVMGLRLENMGLSGNIDVDALVNLPGLRSVSFAYNSFSGAIPELNRLGSLRNLYLGGNQFSGIIPSDFFSKMRSLKKISLSDNKFEGDIPSSLTELSRLTELLLENNQFSGNVPSMEQPTLKLLNVSFNKLKGELPSSVARFGVSSFEGNPDLCGDGTGRECKAATFEPPPPHIPIIPNVDKHNSDSARFKRAIAAFIIMGIMVVAVVAVIIANILRKKKHVEPIEKPREANPDAAEIQVAVSESGSVSKSGGSSRKGSQRGGGVGELVMVNDEKGIIGMPDLMKAAAEILGNGSLGSSYKAALASGIVVVVKRMRSMNGLDRDGFDAELKKLGNLRHPNVLPPLAFHFRKEEKLVIYEYIPKGSLQFLLHADKGPSQDWSTRLKIVKGIARGLAYLHAELAFADLPHGNLKSSNVLLHPDNEPLLSEFGFSPMTYTTNSMVSQALFAYKSPEVPRYGLSPKCDVYCLGIIILEIVTGKFPSQYLSTAKEGTDVVQLVASAMSEGKEQELVDPRITNAKNSLGQVTKMLRIGAACVESNPEIRLEMKEALRRIEEITAEDGTASEVMDSPDTSFSGSQQANGEDSRRRRDKSDSLHESTESFMDISAQLDQDQVSYTISLNSHEQ
ncbi:hypothetical protein Tsubulata_020234 [Turnera subulata]|uniref:Protein kinase domain-containing protein n=1 Tax=Turnera subulata TaxID=218843 RepID=A0A9Q0FXY7_9ROSI|nr:hypothetical protein Tsubulata_020234 [Turnera subulata]